MSVFSGAGQINDLQLLTYLQLDFNLTKIQYSSYVGQHCIKEDILLGGVNINTILYRFLCSISAGDYSKLLFYFYFGAHIVFTFFFFFLILHF